MGPSLETPTLLHANNKGADQPAHPHSLIKAFFINLVSILTPSLETRYISIFYVVSLAEQICLSLTLSEILKTGFLAIRAHIVCICVSDKDL